MDKVAKCGVMDNILSFAAFKNQKELKKSDGAKRSRLTGVCACMIYRPSGAPNGLLASIKVNAVPSNHTRASVPASVLCTRA